MNPSPAQAKDTPDSPTPATGRRPARRAYGKLITLKFPAVCRECGATLAVGASARYYGPAAIYGRGCHPDRRAETPAPARAEAPSTPTPETPPPLPAVQPAVILERPDWDQLIKALYARG